MAIIKKEIRRIGPTGSQKRLPSFARGYGRAMQNNDLHRISLIITTKNESRTISKLLDSIAKQTRRVDQVIISNTGSPISTSLFKRLGFEDDSLRIIELPEGANRAVGRNTAIREATYEHILITDAGCVLKEDWVERMSAELIRGRVKGKGESIVVAGFYEGVYENIFEKCQIPYVLVMPDRLNPKDFLPATRSMGLTRSAWEAVGGFNEAYRYAEDYDFARRLREAKIPIVTVPEAIVYWRPRQALQSFLRMIYEHAYGDAFAGNFRPKVLTIYIRYFLFGLPILGAIFSYQLSVIRGQAMNVFFIVVALYLLYSIRKNYRYVAHWKAIIYLPLLQITSDLAVMWGTMMGRLQARD